MPDDPKNNGDEWQGEAGAEGAPGKPGVGPGGGAGGKGGRGGRGGDAPKQHLGEPGKPGEPGKAGGGKGGRGGRGGAGEKLSIRHVIVYACLVLIGFGVLLRGETTRNQVADNAEQAQVAATRNTLALCALRRDIRQRLKRSEDLLKEHPDIAARFGLTQKEVERSMGDQRRTIKALRFVHCASPKKKRGATGPSGP